MKPILFMLSVLLLTSVTSCHTKDDDSNADYSLEGSWNLSHVSGGISGVDLSFDPGIILWTFNENTGMLTVVNNSESGFSMFQSGTYTYSIEDTPDYKALNINGMPYGSIDMSQNQIHIDQRVADGFFLKLTKVNFIHF
ncbi:hypothetical protein ACS386_03760 [Flavobacteriaceae bacterium LMO-SS05]